MSFSHLNIEFSKELVAFVNSVPPSLDSLTEGRHHYYEVFRGNQKSFITVMDCCAEYGLLEHFKALRFSEEEVRLEIKSNNHELIRRAVITGHLEMVQYFDSFLSMEERAGYIRQNDYNILILPIRANNIDLYKYLEKPLIEMEKKKVTKRYMYSHLREACEVGSLPLVQYMAARLSKQERKKAVRIWHYNALTYASEKGHIGILRELFNYFDSRQEINELLNVRMKLVLRNVMARCHMDATNYLEVFYTRDERIEAIQYNDYEVLWQAVLNGSLDMVKYIGASILTPEQKTSAVIVKQCRAISAAIEKGHLDILKYLMTQFGVDADDWRFAIKMNSFRLLFIAMKTGKLKIIQYLCQYLKPKEFNQAIWSTPELVKAAIFSGNYNLLAMVNQILTMKSLFVWRCFKSKYPIKKFISIDESLLHHVASGDLHSIKAIEGLLSIIERVRLAQLDNYSALRKAISHGHMSLVNHYESYLKRDEIKNLIKEDGYLILAGAIQRGDYDVLRHYFYYLSHSEKRELIFKNFKHISVAAYYGHLKVIQFLMELLTIDEIRTLVCREQSHILSTATHGGQLVIFDSLTSFLTTDSIRDAILSEDYFLIRLAARQGYTKMLRHLFSYLKSHEIKSSIRVDDYYSIRWASENGHFHIIKFLEMYLTKEEVIDAIKACEFDAIQSAARNKQPYIFKYLLNYLSPQEKELAICGFGYKTINWAMHAEAWSVLTDCMQSASGLLYIVERLHTPFVRQCFQAYARELLIELQERMMIYGRHHSSDEFDIEVYEVEQFFLILKGLIYLNCDHDYITMLVNLPLLQTVLHKGYLTIAERDGVPPRIEMSSSIEVQNQLLRCADQVNNDHAFNLLLSFPLVWSNAESHNFYRAAPQSLVSISDDKESSMRKLTVAQRVMFSKLKSQYHSKLTSMGGVASVYDDLVRNLREQYLKKPAIISMRGERTKLPLQFKEWQSLKAEMSFSNEEEVIALQAYHTHIVHTALRFISKPNHWMSKEASYIYASEDETERWSTYQDYIEELVYFYLAATDIDDCSRDSGEQLTLFIRQLALMGRAHNWDHSRPLMVAGKIQYDEMGNELTEEYDDINEGDRPTCFSGVLQRLYQSIPGHPILSGLTKNKLLQDIYVFMRSNVKSILTTLSLEEVNHLKLDIQRYILMTEDIDEMIEPRGLPSITQFNLSSEQVDEFRNQMKHKWGVELADYIDKIITESLRLSVDAALNTHLTKFFMQIDVMGLIGQRASQLMSSKTGGSLVAHCRLLLFKPTKLIVDNICHREAFLARECGVCY